MSYLSNWVARLEEGRTLTYDDLITLRRVQMSLVNAGKHHHQAREGQTMQDVLEQEVERKTAEVTALHQRVFLLERKLADKQRDESKKVRDAERVVLSRAVEFAEAHALFYSSDSDEYAEHFDAVEQTLLAAIAALLAAEAAA
jgi:hypothetical protein